MNLAQKLKKETQIKRKKARVITCKWALRVDCQSKVMFSRSLQKHHQSKMDILCTTRHSVSKVQRIHSSLQRVTSTITLSHLDIYIYIYIYIYIFKLKH